MEHTYFLKTLDWKAEGTYYDEKNHSYRLNGEVHIIRRDTEWTLGGFLEVLFKTPVRFQNDYTIHSTENQTSLAWVSYNPALGKLHGRFEFIGDSIISLYQSEDGVYTGTETLLQRAEQEYYNVGVSFKNGTKLSSWTATLRAQKKGETT